MTHIPQDIMDKTTACILAACGQPRMADIAELVWAERQRCARIVLTDYENETLGYCTVDEIRGEA